MNLAALRRPSTPKGPAGFLRARARAVRALLVVLVGAAFGPVALADDPVNGANLFAAHCTSCHGSAPLTSNSNKIYNGRNARAVIDAAIGNVSDMNSLRATFPANGQGLADLAAYLGNTPSTLTFPSTAVGSTSATQTVNVSASLKAGYSIASLSPSATGDFALAGGTCGTSVATGASCTVLVKFAPSAAGQRTGSLNLSHSNALTPIAIALSGSATGGVAPAPVAGVSPGALTFPSTTVGTTSPSQNVTLSNSGNAPLLIAGIASSDPSSFIVSGGTCAAGGSVAAGSSCVVSVAFSPASGSSPGARSGTLSISHNASGSPSGIALAGTAAAAPAPVASLTGALVFGSTNVGSTSPVQTATLSNSGNAALVVAALSTGNAEFALTGGSCAAGGSVAPGASCTVNLSFTPAAAGSRSATLVITHNAAGGSSSASLSGTGVALSPAIGLSATSLNFTQLVNSTSAAQSITVSNTGTAALTVASLVIGGAQASEFQVAAGSTCLPGMSIAPSASCVVQLTFMPVALGARSANLAIAHNAAGSPSNVALGGTGTAAVEPAVSLNAASVDFGSQTVGVPGPTHAVTLVNSGSAPLTLSAFTLTGASAPEFVRTGTCATGPSLAAGASCTLVFAFTPAALGPRTATLTVTSNAANGAAVLSLAGNGVAAPAPQVTLAPAAIDFGNQAIGSTSAARVISLTNTGSATLDLVGISASSAFSVASNCGSSVPAGGNCSLSVTFSPAGAGTATGSVSIGSNAAGSPQTVPLTGVGVVVSPVLVWLPATPTLAYGDSAVGGTPVVQTLTLLNQGPVPTVIQQFVLAGPQASDFSVAPGTTCAINGSLAAGSSCLVAVAFQPGAAGARSGVLQVVSSGTNPPDVALAGAGVALAQPTLTYTPATLNFVATGSGAAPVQTLVLQNGGSAVAHVTSVSVTSGSFTLAASATGGCAAPPFDLLPGQGCSMTVGWSSNAVATETGTVEIVQGGVSTPWQVALQATRTSAAAGAAPSMSNAGGGGCSISDADSAVDPVLWLLAAMAVVVLRHRRRPS